MLLIVISASEFLYLPDVEALCHYLLFLPQTHLPVRHCPPPWVPAQPSDLLSPAKSRVIPQGRYAVSTFFKEVKQYSFLTSLTSPSELISTTLMLSPVPHDFCDFQTRSVGLGWIPASAPQIFREKRFNW